ncbi:MAG: ribosomal L7Ae/L30e/S12e/Gadd45 family protein [Nanobdellota archaeon]
MAKEDINEITEALNNEKLLIGTDVVMRNLKNGDLKKVYVTSNAPEIIKNDIDNYAKLTDTEVSFLEETNEDLKEICKKRFNVSIVASSK